MATTLQKLSRTWTSKPPEDLETVVKFIGQEGLPLWRQMRDLLNLLVSLLTTTLGGNAIIAIVDNVADLRLYTGQSLFALLQGNVTPFDGGEGAVAKDLLDTTSADDGITIFIDADGHRWKRF